MIRAKISILVLEALVLSCLLGCRTQLVHDIQRWEGVISEMETTHAQELESARTLAQGGGMTPEERAVCWPVAQWLDNLEGIYGQMPASTKAFALWAIFNRIDSPAYPDTAIEVLEQPGQFNEFSDDNPPTEANLEIVRGEYAHWINGSARPCGAGGVFIEINQTAVSIRDDFDPAAANIWRSPREAGS